MNAKNTPDNFWIPQPGDFVTATRVDAIRPEEGGIQGMYCRSLSDTTCELILENSQRSVECFKKGLVLVPEKNLVNAEALIVARAIIQDKYHRLMTITN